MIVSHGTPFPSPCRDCGGTLESVLDLGTLCLSTFPEANQGGHFPAAPLDLCRCQACGLVQLRHTVEPDALFRQYWYQSGINEVMRAELADVAATAANRVGRLSPLDVVLDVGANDGTLLSAFHDTEALRVAYEPALNLFSALRRHCDVLHTEYFPQGVEQEPGLAGRVKILTSIACFYAVQDPHDFITAVRHLLHPKGVWIVQFQDLQQMLQTNAFDNICHEHLWYPSLQAIRRLLHPHGLQVVDAERRPINGGSLRLTIQHETTGTPSPQVAELLRAEADCEHWHTLEQFAWRVAEARTQIRGTVIDLLSRGLTIDLYAASTKSATTLQYCGLGGQEIRQAWERSPEKIGRKTITGIPIVSEDDGRADPPQVLFVGAWQFREAFLKREAAFLAGGGAMLFPLPHCDLVVGEEALRAHV